MLKISNLEVKVDNKQILKGIDLEVKPGEIVAIMGLNGSGKSTLAYSLAGHPKYEISNYQSTNFKNKTIIELDGESLDDKSPDERANMGLFLANQHPVAIYGLTVNSFLWQIFKKRNMNQETGNKNKTNIIEFRKWLESQAKLLDFNPELLKRGLNDGFSGGEKKKLEILQLMVFNPKYVVLDEIDSGLDVDALTKIAKTMALVVKQRQIGMLVITHYNRILKYLKADKVVVIESGKVAKIGGPELAVEIENSGYGEDQ